MKTKFNIKGLNEECEKHHKEMVDKGFGDKPIATSLMLVVCEIAEAVEADRKNDRAKYSLECKGNYLDNIDDDEKFKSEFNMRVKDTFEDEIADAFLRLMDICGEKKINIESHIRWKLRYNRLRGYKHGKLY